MRPGADFAERTTPVRPAVRILLIEDDPISVEIVGTYLRRISYAEIDLYSAGTAWSGATWAVESSTSPERSRTLSLEK